MWTTTGGQQRTADLVFDHRAETVVVYSQSGYAATQRRLDQPRGRGRGPDLPALPTPARRILEALLCCQGRRRRRLFLSDVPARWTSQELATCQRTQLERRALEACCFPAADVAQIAGKRLLPSYRLLRSQLVGVMPRSAARPMNLSRLLLYFCCESQ